MPVLVILIWRISFFWKKEEPPVCVAGDAVITVNHVLIECVDLVEVRKKIFRRDLFIHLECEPGEIFDYLEVIGMFYKVGSMLK